MAVELIDRLDLYHTIFTDPTAKIDFTPDANTWKLAYGLVNTVLNSTGDVREILVSDAEHAYVAWVLSAFIPWVDAPTPPAPKKGRKPDPPLAVTAAREGIKSPNKVCEILNSAVQNFADIISVKDQLLKALRNPLQESEDYDPLGRDTLGMALRKWGVSWRSQVLYTMMVEQVQSTGSDKGNLYKSSQGKTTLTLIPDITSEYSKLLRYLKDQNLLNVNDLKPVIDGTELAKTLDVRPGPWMKEALEVVMAWQLRNPDETKIDGAIQAVRDRKGELVTLLIRHFLQLTIRPLFAKTQTAGVTEKGYRSLNNAPQKYESVDEEEAARPWKIAKNDYALHLLTWVVKSLDTKLTEQNWPLLVPPLLALVDDINPVYKAKGCQLLAYLFKSTSPALLKRTGLAEVFSEAISLCLSYLPTLTPEDDSILILSEAYPALFQLAEVRYSLAAGPKDDPVEFAKKQRFDRIRCYSDLLHVHVLPSIGHVAESNPRIIVTLLTQLSSVMTAKGTDTIADLIHLIPPLKALLTAPLAAAYPSLLTAVAKAMQHLLANTWPRAHVWRVDILEGICFSWIQIVQEESRWRDELETSEGARMITELGAAKLQLKLCVAMLVNAVEAMQRPLEDSEEGDVAQIDIHTELQQLVEIDPRLAELFSDVSE